MRVMGFTEKWAKLHLELPLGKRPLFTTFRLPRKDAPKGRDWHQGEVVQIVFHPRSPQREILGIAKIVDLEPCYITRVTEEEAVADGFKDFSSMVAWFRKIHSKDIIRRPLNKLVLAWELQQA